MSQIKLKILKQGLQYSKIVSCSFFTMQDSYRDFAKYQRHLQKFLWQVKNHFRNVEVRIYTDDTGSDFSLQAAEQYPDVSVIHYDCPEFRDGAGHLGTFGTLVRFLPLFEEHESVWVSDIDIPDNYLVHKQLTEEFSVFTQICYQRKVYGRKYTIIAGRLISRIQLPKSLLTRFLNKVLDGDYTEQRDALNSANKYKPPSRFPYGMDELFLNWPVYDWIKKRDYKIYMNIDYSDPVITKYIQATSKEDDEVTYKFYKTGEKKYLIKMKTVFKKYIPLLVEKYPCLQALSDKLEDPHAFKNDFIERITVKSSDL